MANHSRAQQHIARALSRAQLELQNPAARHEGQIRRPLASGSSLLEPYRYANLADSLALVRPVLGRHGMSVVQSTRTDKDSGLLILETRLIHESGEWLSSDYPVARLEGALCDDPRQTGAALTYARRQSLFALVGIAGQADSDGVLPGASASEHSADSVSAPSHVAEEQSSRLASTACENGVTGGTDRNARTEQRTAAISPTSTERREINDRDRRQISSSLADALTAELSHAMSELDRRHWAITNIKRVRSLLPEDRARLNERYLASAKGVENKPEPGSQPTPETDKPSASMTQRSRRGHSARRPELSGVADAPPPANVVGSADLMDAPPPPAADEPKPSRSKHAE